MWRGERRIRLLVVNDEDDFRETLTKRLEKRGAVVNQAADGLKALVALKKEHLTIAVILVDRSEQNDSRTDKHTPG